MTQFNNKVYYRALNVLNEMIPNNGKEYRKCVIASAYAEGRQNELTADRLRKMLLGDVEDGFISYGEALTLADYYMKAIEQLNKIF